MLDDLGGDGAASIGGGAGCRGHRCRRRRVRRVWQPLAVPACPCGGTPSAGELAGRWRGVSLARHVVQLRRVQFKGAGDRPEAAGGDAAVGG